MKQIIHKSILGLVMVMSSVFVHAAEFMDTSRSDKIIEGEVHVAIGASWFTQNYGDNIPQMQAFNMTPGAMVGIGARVQLAMHDFFAIGTSATFNICNNSMTAIVTSREPDNTAGFTVDNRYCYLNIPVYASLRFNLSDNVKWNVDGGFYYAYGLGGTSKSRIYITYQNDIDSSSPSNLPTRTLISAKTHHCYTIHIVPTTVCTLQPDLNSTIIIASMSSLNTD